MQNFVMVEHDLEVASRFWRFWSLWFWSRLWQYKMYGNYH